MSTNAREIGLYYVLLGILGGVIGSSYSLIMRLELRQGEGSYLKGENKETIYNTIITNHGLIMLFIMVVPLIIGGLGNYIIPKMLGIIDMSYPRMNNGSLMLLIPAIILLLTGSIIGKGNTVYWVLIYPLASIENNITTSVDLMILSIHIIGVSSIMGSINFVITIQFIRKISIYNTNIYVWCVLMSSILLILTIPILGVAVTLMLLDRNINTNYYEYKGGGNSILYQHLFWLFGHPEVRVKKQKGITISKNTMK